MFPALVGNMLPTHWKWSVNIDKSDLINRILSSSLLNKTFLISFETCWKFDTKARKFVFLCYGEETKGYRLYDVMTRRVIHSCDLRLIWEITNQLVIIVGDIAWVMSTILGPFISNDVGTETDHDNEDEQPNHEDHETRQD